MMTSVGNLETVCAEQMQSEAQQRRLLPIELSAFFGFEPSFNGRLLPCQRQMTEVIKRIRDLGGAMNELQWLAETGQVKRGAQRGVTSPAAGTILRAGTLIRLGL